MNERKSHVEFIGKRFGRLTVIGYAGRNEHGAILLKCECDCGNVKVIRKNNLARGSTKSCGCYKREVLKVCNKTHGHKPIAGASPLYRIHQNMKTRCTNPNSYNYKWYGAKGIAVCDEWKQFSDFEKWAMSTNYVEGLSLERKDVEKNYCPDNCTWIPLEHQNKNKRSNIKQTIHGKEMNLADVARNYGFVYGTIQNRYRRGLRNEQLIQPLMSQARKGEIK